MKDKLRRVKGFTLTEMIVVVAIIGILAAILAPTMSTYYWKSRVKSANSDAKMVYNAAQTAAQKCIAADRVISDDDNKSGLQGVLQIEYRNGQFRYIDTADVLSGASFVDINADHSGDVKEAAAARIIQSVNRTVSGADQKCWAVYINNYIVQGSIAADTESTTHVGYYSAGKTLAEERTRTPYSGWLGDGSAEAGITSLAEVAVKYGP